MSGLISSEKKKDASLLIKINEYKISKKYRLMLKNLSFIAKEKSQENNNNSYYLDELNLKENFKNKTKRNKNEAIQLL